MSTEAVQELAPREMKEVEEEEMEQFFAIIRRFRDARAVADRIRARRELEEEERRKKKKRNRVEEKSSGGSWIPKFEPEDFKTAGSSLDSSRDSALLGNGGWSAAEETKMEEDERKLKSLDDPLDLTLAL